MDTTQKNQVKEDIVTYYNNLAQTYDDNRFNNSYGQFIHQQENNILHHYLNHYETAINLDLACGTGRFLKYADYGIDISENMVDIAKQKYPHKNISVEDAESLPFQNAYFNNVIALHLFMHLNLDVQKHILAQVHRVLKKGGYFIFDIPSEKRRTLTGYKSTHWHGGHQISVSSIKKLILPEWELVTYSGIAFFPIHHIPKNFRKKILKLDTSLCHSVFKEYSSHLIFILKKT